MPEGRVLDSPPIESGTSELTISEARRALLDLPEKLARTPERAVTITRRGQPALAILPWEFYESIVETLDILGDPEITWTETALRLVESILEQRIRRLISQRVDQLARSPEEQGKPLIGELAGFRSLRAAGQGRGVLPPIGDAGLLPPVVSVGGETGRPP
jgi:mRNA interferase RelE/StbE